MSDELPPEYTNPPMAYLQEAIRRQTLAENMRRERLEVDHIERYPDALPHGRHSAGTIIEKHFLVPGGEYVGRHRRICDRCQDDINHDELWAVLWDERRVHILCPRYYPTPADKGA